MTIDNIHIYRMLSGDEVIGHKIDETDTTITLEKARVVVFQQLQQSQDGPPTVGVHFYPLSMIRQSKDEFPIMKTAIFGEVTNPEQEFVDQYVESTTSLQLVRAPL